jgi:hypothetical protein
LALRLDAQMGAHLMKGPFKPADAHVQAFGRQSLLRGLRSTQPQGTPMIAFSSSPCLRFVSLSRLRLPG